MKICSFIDCDRKVKARGLCSSHVRQFYYGKSLTKLHKTVEERFLEKIEKNNITNCWNWIAHKGKDGYGTFRYSKNRNTTDRAHVFAYKHYIGPTNNLYVLHKCDNRSCVNPEHLFLGTAKDNNVDMFKKGRANKARGSKAGASKLKEYQVEEIKELLKNPYHGQIREISIKYNISESQTARIKHNQNWKHI